MDSRYEGQASLSGREERASGHEERVWDKKGRGVEWAEQVYSSVSLMLVCPTLDADAERSTFHVQHRCASE
jgi:hypothetical protein